ncbi:MAG: hypothetical protein M3Q29_16820 [Chloroflexota bacterium]|nr:hypothetical protein [Chloroflexota bacterium]
MVGSADTLLIECKPADKLETESVRQQVAIGSAWCEEHGCRFLLITDAELRVGSCLANAKLLYRYSRLHLPETLQRYVRATLPLYPALVTFGTLVRCLTGSEQARLWKQSDLEARSFAFALLFHGVVATDLDRPLVDASPVWLPDPSLPSGGSNMVRSRFAKGTTYLYKGDLYLVLQTLLDDHLLVENQTSGRQLSVSKKELVDAWSDGDLCFTLKGTNPRSDPQLRHVEYTFADFAGLLPSQRNVAWQRYELIKPYLSMSAAERGAAWRARDENQSATPTSRTIRRWLELFIDHSCQCSR